MTSAINKEPSPTREPGRMHDGIDLFDLLAVLAKHKLVLIAAPTAVAVAAVALSFLVPNSYKANTRLLPPQQAQSGAAALLSQLGGVGGAVASSAPALKNPNDIYLGMLRSRRIADRLVAKFDLKTVYDTPSLEKARHQLESNTSFVSGKDGLITIEVEDTGQERVANMANAYVDELLALTRTLAVTEAGQRRLFFERQLEQTKNKLVAVEAELKGALGTRGMISVDSDSRTIVETIARLRARTSAKEVELNSLRAFVTSNNQEFKRVEQELNSLRQEQSRLENGAAGADGGADDGKKSPGLENIQLVRDLKYQQTLYELLTKQYEVARLDEAKSAPILQVLDAAVQPERKSKPSRLGVGVIAFALAEALALLWVFLRVSLAARRGARARNASALAP